MAQLLSGREVASAMNDALLTRAGALAERGILPTLAIVRVGENESDLSYERGAEKRAQKVGVGIRKLALPGDVGAETLLETIRTLYAQQREMYGHRTHRVADRIVSIAQPYILKIIF